MAGNNLGGQWVPLKQLRVMSQWGGSQRLDFRANMLLSIRDLRRRSNSQMRILISIFPRSDFERSHPVSAQAACLLVPGGTHKHHKCNLNAKHSRPTGGTVNPPLKSYSLQMVLGTVQKGVSRRVARRKRTSDRILT